VDLVERQYEQNASPGHLPFPLGHVRHIVNCLARVVLQRLLPELHDVAPQVEGGRRASSRPAQTVRALLNHRLAARVVRVQVQVVLGRDLTKFAHQRHEVLLAPHAPHAPLVDRTHGGGVVGSVHDPPALPGLGVASSHIDDCLQFAPVAALGPVAVRPRHGVPLATAVGMANGVPRRDPRRVGDG